MIVERKPSSETWWVMHSSGWCCRLVGTDCFVADIPLDYTGCEEAHCTDCSEVLAEALANSVCSKGRTAVGCKAAGRMELRLMCFDDDIHFCREATDPCATAAAEVDLTASMSLRRIGHHLPDHSLVHRSSPAPALPGLERIDCRLLDRSY